MLMWQRLLLLYLAISIGCAFWQPDIVFTQSSNPLTLFDIDNSNWNESREIHIGGEMGDSIENSQKRVDQQSSGSGGFLQFIIDATSNVMDFISMLFGVITAPIQIINAGKFPIELMYLLGIPLAFMGIMALISFIRGTG